MFQDDKRGIEGRQHPKKGMSSFAVGVLGYCRRLVQLEWGGNPWQRGQVKSVLLLANGSTPGRRSLPTLSETREPYSAGRKKRASQYTGMSTNRRPAFTRSHPNSMHGWRAAQ
jgi:hypothetical protein